MIAPFWSGPEGTETRCLAMALKLSRSGALAWGAAGVPKEVWWMGEAENGIRCYGRGKGGGAVAGALSAVVGKMWGWARDWIWGLRRISSALGVGAWA